MRSLFGPDKRYAASTTYDQPWTKELGNLARTGGLRRMAEIIRDTGAHEHIRSMWALVDRSLPHTPALDPNQRVFAGIADDGSRYIEVYRGSEDPSVYGVFFGDPRLIDHGMQLAGGAQRGLTNPDGSVVIAWADPNPTKHDTPAELFLRPVETGTSSAYTEVGDRASYGGEYFPMAHMQRLAGFDTNNLRACEMDYGQALPADIQVNGPATPPSAPPAAS